MSTQTVRELEAVATVVHPPVETMTQQEREHLGLEVPS